MPKYMKITEALRMCSELWHYIADHRLNDKTVAIRQLGMPIMHSQCPICEWTLQNHPVETDDGQLLADCNFCPMRDFWKKFEFNPNDVDTSSLCCSLHSPYEIWTCYEEYDEQEHDQARHVYARTIANEADRLLRKITG